MLSRVKCGFLACILSCLGPAVQAAETVSQGPGLVLLTWSDYIDPELIAEFEQRFQTHVSMVYFQTDDARSEILLETEGQGYDVILVSGAELALYQRRGWLVKLNPERMPMLKHIDPQWQAFYAAGTEYGAPYFWGTLGVAYRRDLLTTPITHWMQLFQPDAELRQRMVMIDASRELIGAALKALGHSLNSEDPAALEAAEALLMAQKDAVKAYAYPALTAESDLVAGSVTAVMMYNGDAQLLSSFNNQMAYVVPSEGCNLWVDYLAVSAASVRRELAEAFINFLNEPAQAARSALYANYATPNKAAEAHLPEEYFANPVIYPPSAVLARCEADLPLSAQGLRRRNAIINRVLAAD